MFPKKDRRALSTTAFAVVLVIVLIVGGAIGVYYPRSGKSASSSSSTMGTTSSTAMSSNTATSSSASATSSTLSSSVSSNTTRTTPALAHPLFNFTINSGPANILIAPGNTLIYANIGITPLPSAYLGQAAGLEVGAGDELVVLRSVAPSGLSVHFFGSNLTDTIYEEVGAGFPSGVELQLTAAPDMTPGTYPVMIQGSSGTESVNYTFMVQVVKYLVTFAYNRFSPGNLNVTVGSTVYWMNISTDPNGYSDVVFKTISVQSSGLFPCALSEYGPSACGVYSYTFTTAGTYPYICNALPFCGGGTITVS